jgi:3-hydroxy-9,10-secoandrosta-1,3,5(10)-triene-9,17-dione monooxygenase reductase component
MRNFDKMEFRRALGDFATGVTVITTLAPDGQPVGVTASSFNSVSLDPPLVLWSLDKGSYSIEAFTAAEYFNVNVLAADQVALSNRFARKGEAKFAGLEVNSSDNGIPLLSHCAARFQCQTRFQYEGGDHTIFVGEVLNFDRTGRSGLVFHQGSYAVSASHPTALQEEEDGVENYVEDYLPYLSGRAFDQVRKHFEILIAKLGLNRYEFRVLMSLKDKGNLSLKELLMYTVLEEQVLKAQLQKMVQQGTIDLCADRVQLTAPGKDKIERIMNEVKVNETEMLSLFSADEARQFKQALKRLIAWTDQHI